MEIIHSPSERLRSGSAVYVHPEPDDTALKPLA